MPRFGAFCVRSLAGLAYASILFAPWPVLRAAELGGKPEKSEVIVTYAQPSAAFTHLWVAQEAGLYKKHGLNAKLQLLNPQVREFFDNSFVDYLAKSGFLQKIGMNP